MIIFKYQLNINNRFKILIIIFKMIVNYQNSTKTRCKILTIFNMLKKIKITNYKHRKNSKVNKNFKKIQKLCWIGMNKIHINK